ncbi:class I SAM-dependent methyltransferase [Microbacterium lushaniae]|nr:class I SAM-dependent methyltransferase [Microbacterium lushaniae]KAA9150528.1 class I SAM-dependent methyltransferase [Microbacterium lushaniae]
MPGPMHFDEQAGEYERARPPYPDALWARLRELGALRPGRRAVDLGAGTGQATGPLLAAGMDVVAVEPGPRLAARLRERYPAARVQPVAAEDAELDDAAFDLAVAATSLHWMDLDVVLPKVRRALTPDGWFLVWRNVFGDPDAAVTPFRERVDAIVARRGGGSRRTLEDTGTTAERLIAGGLFTLASTDTFRWSLDLDEEAVRRLFRTFSDWTPAEADEAAAAVRELGGVVTERYTSWLIALR